MKVMLDPGAYEPTRAHDTDAGLDIYAKDEVYVFPNDSAIFHTGVHVELPKGCAGLLVSKSGLNVKHDITNTGLVKLYNHGPSTHVVRAGDKISQLVIIPVRYEPVEIVDSISGGERGDNGFGSTGR